MGQFYSGQHGQLLIKPSADSGLEQKVGNLKNWNITFQQSVLDTTCLEDTDRTILHGVRSFSGSSSLLYYQETASNLFKMTNTFVTGKSARTDYRLSNFGQNFEPEYANVILRLFDGNNRDIGFTCLITNFAISCTVGEVVQADISFEGHGLPPTMTMIT